MDLFALMASDLVAKGEALAAELSQLPESQRIDALNQIRRALHHVSPFRDEPVDCVLWVPSEQVRANDYNPNAVAPPEMRLLQRSIEEDGYTQPIVVCEELTHKTVVDGFHRYRVGNEAPNVRKRVKGYLPVTVGRWAPGDLKERMAATIRHNRARGKHAVVPMAEIVATLIRKGWSDSDIAKELGMDSDEVLRFKQQTGLPGLFRDQPYSKAWETR